MKNLPFLTAVLALLFAASVNALEPGDTLWTRTYGGSGWDRAYSVQLTTDGGYIVGGYTESFGAGGGNVWLLKTDENGDTLWTQTYGGSGSDVGYSVQQTTDGGYIIAGYTDSFGAGGMDVYLVKTDANGDALWTRTYGGSDTDRGCSVQQTTDGGYVVAGFTRSFGAGSYDVYLVKTDASGDTLWTRTYGGSAYDAGWCVQQTTDGGYILTGFAESFGPSADVYLVKTDANGDTLWTRTHGGPYYEMAYTVQQTTDGGYIAAGYGGKYIGYLDYDFYLVKTDANGDTLWTRTYGGSEWDYGWPVQQTTDGGYILAGYTISFGAGDNDLYLVKTDAEGDTLWTRAYGGSDFDGGNSVLQTNDGAYIVAGRTQSFGAGSFDVWLLKVAGEEQLAVTIEIIPDDPPVTVPQGGSFGFTGILSNHSGEPQVTDAWTMAEVPRMGRYGPLKQFNNLVLSPYETLSGHFTQHVSHNAPVGRNYIYLAYCGDYPWPVTDSSYFEFRVIPGISSGGEDLGWLLSGSFDKSDEPSRLPSEFALLSNYPNPFNASTVISYELPHATHVELEIFNISGQRVATLVEGKQEAGYRSVVWDASLVASGIYFYNLTAGDFSETKRMMLVR